MSSLGYECCLCGKICTDWGNDPWPLNVSDDARCCDVCNDTKVLPARLAQMLNKKENN